jgi:hypothetical protein
MRSISFFLNTSVVVFGVAAAILSLSSPILAVICGVITALATGASLMSLSHYMCFIYTQILSCKYEMMRLFGVFQQAGSFDEKWPTNAKHQIAWSLTNCLLGASSSSGSMHPQSGLPDAPSSSRIGLHQAVDCP